MMIKGWGERFERDHDILPLFTDVYKALKKKGIEFPGDSSNSDQYDSKPGDSLKS